MGSKSKFSERGIPLESRVDVAALSPKARRQVRLLFSVPDLTQNASTASTVQSLGYPGMAGTGVVKVIGATCVFDGTVPVVSGGTATILVQKIANDGSTATSLTTATSILSKTAKVAFDLTSLATPLEVNGDETIRVLVTTSNNAVGTQQVGGTVTVLGVPVEDSVISD